MSRQFWYALLVAALLSAGSDVAAETLRGMVKAVYDGDTVVLVGRDSGRITVRLYGIDAPETRKPESPGQPYASQSRRVLMYKLLGREVTAEVQEQDQYGRAVAVVRYAGRDMNAEMVAEGLAWAYRQYLEGPYSSQYIRLEEQARRQRRGLWRDANPRPPWEFRQSREKGR
jgi:endonuclease YncB( thermonuclease family)